MNRRCSHAHDCDNFESVVLCKTSMGVAAMGLSYHGTNAVWIFVTGAELYDRSLHKAKTTSLQEELDTERQELEVQGSTVVYRECYFTITKTVCSSSARHMD